MSRFVLLHGTGGSPDSNWLPWLRSRLLALDKHVQVPTFPTPEGQSQENWLAAFESQVGELHGDMVLVGHSMGCGLLARLLEQSTESIQASFFVAGWSGLLGLPDFDPLIESFFVEPFDWSAIRARAGRTFCYHGANDPYVPLAMGQEFAHNLGQTAVVFDEGGHLNAEAGFTEFPELLEDICSL